MSSQLPFYHKMCRTRQSLVVELQIGIALLEGTLQNLESPPAWPFMANTELKHVTEGITQISFEHWQAKVLLTLLGNLVQSETCATCKECDSLVFKGELKLLYFHLWF